MKKLGFLLLFICFQAAAQQMTPETLWKLGRISEPEVSPDGKAVIYGVRNYNLASNKGQNSIYSMSLPAGSPQLLIVPEINAFSARWRPDGKKITYLSAESGEVQVWEMNPDGSAKERITNITGGINQYSYSPDMLKLMYTMDVKLDKAANEIYPDLPASNARIIDALMYRHWDSWHDYSYSHVFILPMVNGKPNGEGKDILKDEKYDAPLQPFGGDEQIAWSADGKFLAYACKKVSGTEAAKSTNSDIYLYDVATGKTDNLSAGMMGYDKDPVFSPDGKKILWMSMERPGYEADKNRLISYDLTAKQKRDLSTDFKYSIDQVVYNKKGDKLFFSSGLNGTHQLFEMSLGKKSGVRQITNGEHDYIQFKLVEMPAPMLVGTKMNITQPAELYTIDIATGKENQVTFINKEVWDNIPKAKVQKRMVKSSDGKEILTWVIYPPDFDPNKKYPTLLYCQGGPQSMVSQFFSYRWNFQLMASRGYIVVAPNRRGLPGFGQEWNDQIVGDYGGQAMQDYVSAIDDVAKEAYVNKDKMGAVGASFGGYSVYWLAGHHNDRFKTFISHCGMFNMESWYGTTEETFFANNDQKGSYWDNPENYYKFSPHRFVNNWDTPILVIHNEKDFRVPLGQGMEAFTAAQLKGIPSRFLYFPDENHWVTKPQNSVLWQRVFFEWLDKYLK